MADYDDDMVGLKVVNGRNEFDGYRYPDDVFAQPDDNENIEYDENTIHKVRHCFILKECSQCKLLFTLSWLVWYIRMKDAAQYCLHIYRKIIHWFIYQDGLYCHERFAIDM